MIFEKNENKLEPRANFHKTISDYYSRLAGNEIPKDLFHELVDKITNTQYENYKRFWKQYPKSRKRYSKLKIEDLEHLYTQYELTDFLKKKDFDNYKKFSMILLSMTEKEFSDYETRKYQYETK